MNSPNPQELPKHGHRPMLRNLPYAVLVGIIVCLPLPNRIHAEIAAAFILAALVLFFVLGRLHIQTERRQFLASRWISLLVVSALANGIAAVV